MKIGVFDSGVGGKSVAEAISKALPEHEIVFRDDKQHVPYGLRPPEEILGFVMPIIQSMAEGGCQVIVVACNTVTTTLIDDLRRRFRVPLVAIEPMVKPAAELTKNGVIAVCATPTTLESDRYKWLKQNFADGIEVLEPDCSDWALMIEQNQLDRPKIDRRINEVLAQHADIIVLACTHYHWIEEEIDKLVAGRARILQPEQSIIKQLRRVLLQLR